MEQSEINRIIAESPRRKCSCGNEYFDAVTVMVEVSALSSGTGKSETLLAGVLVCSKCGLEAPVNRLVTA